MTGELSIFCAPSRYVQGRDATRSLGEQMVALGLSGPAAVIAGGSARRLLQPVWQETFSRTAVDYAVYPFGGECSAEEIEAAQHFAAAGRARVIVGAGGGKVLDTARAVAANLGLPIVLCPSAASSDAPCSALSVVYTLAGQFERYIFYRRNPDLVLVDTAVIAKSPPRLLVAGMGDALATWFEAKTVVCAGKKNQVGGSTTASALCLADFCYRTLIADGRQALAAVRAGSLTPALSRVVEANTLLSGLGFESGGLAIAHSLHNGLTTAPQTHSFMHGEKVAFGLIVQLVVEGQPAALIDEVLTFCRDVGLPVSLADIGLNQADDETIASIAERTVAPGETCHNEPFAVSAGMIADGIRAADRLGSSRMLQAAEA